MARSDPNAKTSLSKVLHPPQTALFKHFFTTVFLTMADHPIYIPDWLDAELTSLDPYPMIRERIEVKNWLTHGLIEEIQEAFPTAGDLEVGTGVRNKEVFADKCTQLFPPGRVFASNKQVEQAASRFLEAWAVHGVHDGKKIMCHFGVSGKKKRPSPSKN
jgi:hypothetical protein